MTHILDDPFHSAALQAFLEQARLEGGWPDREKTRQRAYRLYEEALRGRGERKLLTEGA